MSERGCQTCAHFDPRDGKWFCKLSGNYRLEYGLKGYTDIVTSHMRAKGGLQSKEGPCGPEAKLWQPA